MSGLNGTPYIYRQHKRVKKCNKHFLVSGYVLSKESLRRLNEEAFTDSEQCRNADQNVEDDKEIGRCLRNVGV